MGHGTEVYDIKK